MIFAWNDNDPATGKNDWESHGPNKLTKSLILRNYKSGSIDEQSILPSDTYTHTFRVKDVRFLNLISSSMLCNCIYSR
jgi:hypothetical protein